MRKNNENRSNDDLLLLKKFNEREASAFAHIYQLYYKDFNYYAAYLFDGCNTDSEDIIHDILIRIWQDSSIQFDNLTALKAFVFISIKNSFKNYINHNKYKQKYHDVRMADEKFEYDVIECEIYSYVEDALNILPPACAQIFKMYLEGYKPDEIAIMLDKNIQTVYNTKQLAISILKKKLSKDKLLLILILLS